MSCSFCRSPEGPLPTGGIIFEDPFFEITHWSSEDLPTYLGILLLRSKRHVPTLADLTPEEGLSLGAAVQKASRSLKDATGAELVYLYGFQEAVRHLHLFLTARYPGTPPEDLRLEVSGWPAAPRGGAKEIEALCETLRRLMGERALPEDSVGLPQAPPGP